MASSSAKKIAKSNSRSLRYLHSISFVLNLIVIVRVFLFRESLNLGIYILLSSPAFFCQYVLEKWGRPSSISGKVRNLDDINGPGLYEYMFDCIYITWACDALLVILGTNKVWFLYLIIPAFATHKAFSILRGVFANRSPKRNI